MARFGMLECGKNFRGSLPELCLTCDQIDDENHRLNFCKKWEDNNLYMSADKVDFENIYGDDIETLKDIMEKIAKVWNVRTGNGGMNWK